MVEKYWKNTMIFPWWETSNRPWAPLSKPWKPKNSIQHTDQHQETRNIDRVKPGVYCDTSGTWCFLSLKVLPGGYIFRNANVYKEWRNLRPISGLSWSYSLMEPKAEQAGDVVTWNAGSWDKEDSAWRHLPCFTVTSTIFCFFQIFSSPCCFWAHPHRAEHGKDKPRVCTSAHSPDVGGEGNASVQSCSRPDFCQLCACSYTFDPKNRDGKRCKWGHQFDHVLPKAPDFPILPLNSFGHWITLVFKGGEGGFFLGGKKVSSCVQCCCLTVPVKLWKAPSFQVNKVAAGQVPTCA